MKKNKKKSKSFIPTQAEWGQYYAKWHDKMSKSLWMFGSEHECREAVHEAFLKAMGLSDHLHLREELTPKVEGCWYGFLRNQAKGILSNRHKASDRFEPIKEWEIGEETFAEDDWGDVDDSDAILAPQEESALDSTWLRRQVRGTVQAVCHEAGLKDRDVRAFFRFVLDDCNGREVLAEIPELHTTNNLFQVKCKIMRLLRQSAGQFAEAFNEVLAA